METFDFIINVFFHLKEHLDQWTLLMGPWLYLLLFLVIFAETGLVVTPFLPGDSLLFALGALAATGPLDIWLLFIFLAVAAILGNVVNYAIGRYLGPKVFNREDSWLLNQKHLIHAQHFYERHGAKTIVITRFVPIVRTFAPFVAGIGKMGYPRFLAYNLIGGGAWVGTCLAAGYWFGNLPWVDKHFELVVLGIIAISLMPMVIEFLRARRRSHGFPAVEPPLSTPAREEGEENPRFRSCPTTNGFMPDAVQSNSMFIKDFNEQEAVLK